MQAALTEAVLSSMRGRVGDDGVFATQIDDLAFIRIDEETAPRHALYRPALCINVQGSKQLLLQDKVIDYDEMQYLVVSVDLPVISGAHRASPGRPFLAIALGLDLGVLGEMVQQIGGAPKDSEKPELGVIVGDLSPQLGDCMLRIVRLLETPEAVSVLYPLIARELYYWLLRCPNGLAIARLVQPSGNARQIVDAINAIRTTLAKPLRVEELSHIANMSPSSFHAQFKAVTSMTPVQFQKRLRLLEARRLMKANLANASEAAYQVGYESVSQFSREYARMFGAPPKRDVARLRLAVA